MTVLDSSIPITIYITYESVWSVKIPQMAHLHMCFSARKTCAMSCWKQLRRCYRPYWLWCFTVIGRINFLKVGRCWEGKWTGSPVTPESILITRPPTPHTHKHTLTLSKLLLQSLSSDRFIWRLTFINTVYGGFQSQINLQLLLSKRQQGHTMKAALHSLNIDLNSWQGFTKKLPSWDSERLKKKTTFFFVQIVGSIWVTIIHQLAI